MVLIKGQDLLKQSASSYFQQLFHEEGQYGVEVSSEFLDNRPILVSLEDNNNLMKPFTEKEIIDVIWAMEFDKALGLDGFSIHFYKVC